MPHRSECRVCVTRQRRVLRQYLRSHHLRVPGKEYAIMQSSRSFPLAGCMHISKRVDCFVCANVRSLARLVALGMGLLRVVYVVIFMSV